MKTAIVWFRLDLRLKDNPALLYALDNYDRVIPVYILDEASNPWAPGAASQWWLHKSLLALSKSLEEKGSRLILLKGDSLQVLKNLIKQSGATGVFWNRRYEKHYIERDTQIKKSLDSTDSSSSLSALEVKSFNSALLYEPWEIENNSKKPFQVFTPFWRKQLSLDNPPKARNAPKNIPGSFPDLKSLSVDELNLLPKIKWYSGFEERFSPGEAGAQAAWKAFLKPHSGAYQEKRDFPWELGTSRLSAHLHFGEISVRQIWHDSKEWGQELKTKQAKEGLDTYVKEIGWREFAHHLIYHFPHTQDRPLRENFLKFPWKQNPKHLEAWKKGMTGYPIVDAGMRELWHTGWMHNRVRMIVASFLVKHLMISWKEGALWFWDTLVDADLAANTLGWQWAGGCGADAAPYFRIFNPMTQGERFDEQGAYIRKWVPELAKLSNKYIHQPWEASDLELRSAGIILGKDYPKPIVDHTTARNEALKAFKTI